MSTRRDDRAEPEDDASTSRIDVVNIADRGGGAPTSLRRELSKLQLQAATVERSLEEQRRSSSDAIERAERAAEQTLQLEVRLVGAEAEAASLRKANEAAAAELKTLRAERDELARAQATRAAQATTEEATLATSEATLVKVTAERDRAEAALAEVEEKRARTESELSRVKAQLAVARQETEVAEQDAAIVGEQATKVREDAAKTRAELATARDEADTLRAQAAKGVEDAGAARAQLTALREELEAAARNAAQSEERAEKLATSHAELEDTLRRLREDVAGAFARSAHPTAPADASGAASRAAAPERGPGSRASTTQRPHNFSVPPPMHVDLHSKVRHDLLAQLADPDGAVTAATALRDHPEWLREVPPPTLLAALAGVDYDAQGAVFELARAWDREPLGRALVEALHAESEPRRREHQAWLLKHLAAPSSWRDLAELATNEDEPAQLRRWLLEGLDRLAAGRAIGWRELGELVTVMSRNADASLRDGVVGILLSLDRSDEKHELLLEILKSDDDEAVLVSAVSALTTILPVELDQELTGRLLAHRSSRVQQVARALVERAKQTKP